MIELRGKKIASFEYIHGDGFIHRIHPGIKALAALATSYAAIRLEAPLHLVAALTAWVALMALAKIPAKCIIADTRILFYQLIITTPLAFLSANSPTEAAYLVIATTLRFGIMTMGASFLVRTTNPWRLHGSMEKIFGARIAFLLLVAARYVPTLGRELREINAAQEQRRSLRIGAEPSSVTRSASLIVPFVRKSVETAEEVAVAAYARGMVPIEDSDENIRRD